GYQLMRQNGRLLLRLDAVERRVAELERQLARVADADAEAALPVGTEAPAFELPDLGGRRRALAEFRGRPLLVVFFNPQCGFCVQIAPGLAALPPDGGEAAPAL